MSVDEVKPPGPMKQREKTTQARELREARKPASATVSKAPPVIDAEFVMRNMSRYDMSAKDVSVLMKVTPTAVSQWLQGKPIPLARQRELMDLFGEPMRLQEASMDELIREVVRRAMGGR